MRFWSFLGFAFGMLVGVSVGLFALAQQRKKGVVDQDERTSLMNLLASSWAFYGLGIFAYVGWVADNVMRHLNGLDPVFFSPWGIMVFAGIVLYLGAYWYHNYRMSAGEGEPDEANEKEKLQRQIGIIGALLACNGGLFATLEKVPQTFHYISIVLVLILVGILAALLTKLGKLNKKQKV